jgi:hypothetical protein
VNEILEGIAGAWASLPAAAAALIVLAGGWLGAFALRFAVAKLLQLARFDRLSDRTGLSEFLRKGNVKYSPSKLAGAIAYWIALLAVFLEVARRLDLDIYLAISGKLAAALPNLAAGLLVAVVGYLIVTFIANFTLTIALNASLPHARLLSRAIKWLGAVVVVTMALEQIGLGRSIVEYIFQAMIAAIALGAALAFGLGCKDMARDALQRGLRNLREREREGQGGSDLEG